MLFEKFSKFAVIVSILFILQFPAYIYSQQNEIPITTMSEEAYSYFMEGRYKYENIQYATAAALFDEAILTDPGFAMAYLYRARCGGGYNIVQENLQKAEGLISSVTEGEKRLILFQKALEEGNDAAQKQHIQKLLVLFPNDKRVHFNAGLYYDFITDPVTAIMHYLKAVQFDENYSAAYNKIGYDFIDLGFLIAAEEAFKKYISLIPDSPNPYDSYAELLLKKGQYEESVIEYRTAYQKDVLFTQALAGIGHNYIFLGEFEKARENYLHQHEKAVRSNEKLEALLWVAVSYIHEGNISNAINTLELRAQFAGNEKLVPDIIETKNLLGILLTETGKYDEAKIRFDEANLLSESSDLVESVKESFITGALINECFWLTKCNKLNEAEEHMKKCYPLVKDNQNIVMEKRLNLVSGIYALRNVNPEEALQYFSRADNDNPYTWSYIAKAYEELGYEDKAAAFKDRIRFWNQNSFDFALVRYKLEFN
jgi:tetratricopeptide (TPR) repeat protein